MVAFHKGRTRLERHENRIAFLFILLPIVGFCIFTVGTMIATFAFSFTDFNPVRGNANFIGLKNFSDLFTSQTYRKGFFNSIFNTLFMLIGVPTGMLAGLILAQLIHSRIKGSKVFQALFYLPAVSSAVALNIVWRYIFNNEFGVINLVLGVKIPWLSDEWLIKLAIIFKNTVNGMGGTMILYLASMLSVPKDYYEAADIDGAGALTKFFKITLPMITPITFYLLITGIIAGLQSYADAEVFGAGNTGSQTIVYYVWYRGIYQNRYGIASAASIILAASIMLVTVVQFRFSNKWVFED